MKIQKLLGVLVLGIAASVSAPADACSLSEGSVFPQDDTVNYPTNGLIKIYAPSGQPHSVQLKEKGGRAVAVSLIENEGTEYFYAPESGFSPKTAYELNVDMTSNPWDDDRFQDISFITDSGADNAGPATEGLNSLNIVYHRADQVVRYFGGGMCSAEDYVLAEVESDSFRETLGEDGEPLGAHYQISMQLKPFTNENHTVVVSMSRQNELGLELLSTAWATSLWGGTFEAQVDEIENVSEATYVFRAEDVAGNVVATLGTVTFGLNPDAPVLLASTFAVTPPLPPPPVVGNSAAGGCSLSANPASRGIFPTALWMGILAAISFARRLKGIRQ